MWCIWITLTLGRLFSFMIRNTFLYKNQHVWEKIQIEGGLHRRSHNIPLIKHWTACLMNAPFDSLWHKCPHLPLRAIFGFTFVCQILAEIYWQLIGKNPILLFVTIQYHANFRSLSVSCANKTNIRNRISYIHVFFMSGGHLVSHFTIFSIMKNYVPQHTLRWQIITVCYMSSTGHPAKGDPAITIKKCL